jgi:hypothetical protein
MQTTVGCPDQASVRCSNPVYAGQIRTLETMVSETEVACLDRGDAPVSMTIALIADIHGNLAALQAVLDPLTREHPDEIVCLGDIAATGPQPQEVLAGCAVLGVPS